ncbi:hypothetical protein LXL04_019763 [Taraxacum kok-saghyz]
MPERIQEVPCITQAAVLEPLAFVAPDAEEEVILGEISKGKVAGSELMGNRLRNIWSSENITEVLGATSSNGKHGSLLSVDDMGKMVIGMKSKSSLRWWNHIHCKSSLRWWNLITNNSSSPEQYWARNMEEKMAEELSLVVKMDVNDVDDNDGEMASDISSAQSEL